MAKSANEWMSMIITTVLVSCALIITGLVVRREIFPPVAALETSYYSDWKALTEAGHRLGDASAPVQMVMFYDYQCPFCRSVEPTIEQLRAKYQDQLAVTYRHFLLETIHPQARTAALAAECGAEQGRFATLHQVLFNNAARLGELPWGGLAAEAGIPDIEAFEGCLMDGRHAGRLASDRSAVDLVGISSIPGLVINGTVVTGAKSFDVLDGLVQVALKEVR